MGYRTLLKKYVRFLEVNVGDNFIESAPAAAESTLSERDLRELRTIAAEIFREAHAEPHAARVENWNYRLRILLNHYGVGVEEAAHVAGVDEARIRGWRTHPRSPHYVAMTEAEFERFERALHAWFEGDRAEAAALTRHDADARSGGTHSM